MTDDNTKPSYYAIIPANVRYDNDLSLLAKLIFGEISALSSKTGECWASNLYFAKLYGKSKNHISKIIGELVIKSYVKLILIKGDNNKIVDKRVLSIIVTPLIKNDDTPIIKNDDTPIIKNRKENNTSKSNNTSINKLLILDLKDCKYLDNKNFNDIFNDYVEYRKEKKRPLTNKACKLIFKTLNAVDVSTAIKMIEQTIMNDWQGIFPLKQFNNKQKFIKEEPIRRINKCSGCGYNLTDGNICYTPDCKNYAKSKENNFVDINSIINKMKV